MSYKECQYQDITAPTLMKPTFEMNMWVSDSKHLELHYLLSIIIQFIKGPPNTHVYEQNKVSRKEQSNRKTHCRFNYIRSYI